MDLFNYFIFFVSVIKKYKIYTKTKNKKSKEKKNIRTQYTVKIIYNKHFKLFLKNKII